MPSGDAYYKDACILIECNPGQIWPSKSNKLGQ